MYSLRKAENFHLLLWLIKDLCWVSGWQVMGLIIAIPTIGMAVYIALTTRKSASFFYFNLAILAWILANTCWMLADFFVGESQAVLYANILTVVKVLFFVGLTFIVFYHARSFFADLQNKKKLY
jgi:hypothetical protein